jgi:hypothetical protein
MGRPPKYANDEERRAARRQQNRERLSRQRQAVKSKALGGEEEEEDKFILYQIPHKEEVPIGSTALGAQPPLPPPPPQSPPPTRGPPITQPPIKVYKNAIIEEEDRAVHEILYSLSNTFLIDPTPLNNLDTHPYNWPTSPSKISGIGGLGPAFLPLVSLLPNYNSSFSSPLSSSCSTTTATAAACHRARFAYSTAVPRARLPDYPLTAVSLD